MIINSDEIDDYDDENYQNADKYHDLLVKRYPFKALLLSKRKDQQI